MKFEDIPVRKNGSLDVDASWWNTIRSRLIKHFPNQQVSSTPFEIVNNQDSLANIEGLLLDQNRSCFWKIRYKIKRSDNANSYIEFGTITAWVENSQITYKRSVDVGNALGDGVGSPIGDYRVGSEESLQIDSQTGQAKYLSSNMTGASYQGSMEWKITETWGA